MGQLAPLLHGQGGELTVETIAILDDDEDLRCALAEMYESLSGVRCVTAATVAELIAQGPAVLQTRVALLDINLGAELPTGFDAYEWLRTNGYAGRVAFLTGHAHDDPLMKRAQAFGNVAVLEKPVPVDCLLGLVPPGVGDEHPNP
jgi:FixJ family two-component response regulator